MKPQINQWPNKLGYDVETDDYCAEVWQTRLDGIWGIRTFTDGSYMGRPHKWVELDPAQYLFMTPRDAADICFSQGNLVDE